MPTFNKKEEIFQTLCEYAVPNIRAAWFIKMIAAHNMGTQDARNRRKASVDQSMGEAYNGEKGMTLSLSLHTLPPPPPLD